MLGSGFIFDSDLVKTLPFPYPYLFLAIAILAAAAFTVILDGRIIIRRPVGIIGYAFMFLVGAGLISSLLSGAGDVFALGMKTSSIFLVWLFFLIGANLAERNSIVKQYAHYGLIIAVLLAALLTTYGDAFGQFNHNWIGITVIQAYMFHETVRDGDKDTYSIFGYLIISLGSWFLLGARGVFAAATISALLLLLTSLSPFFIRRRVVKVAIYCLPLVGVFIAFLGVWLYNSNYYMDIVLLSLELTGKSLDSSRLIRWDSAIRLFLERPILGWGIDANLSRVDVSGGYGDLHNFFLEFIFRVGSVGLLTVIFIFWHISRYFSRHSATARTLGVYVGLFVLLSTYGLGGVTHWPGSYNFWLILGALIKRNPTQKMCNNY
jgi:O-antigen ligase